VKKNVLVGTGLVINADAITTSVLRTAPVVVMDGGGNTARDNGDASECSSSGVCD